MSALRYYTGNIAICDFESVTPYALIYTWWC